MPLIENLNGCSPPKKPPTARSTTIPKTSAAVKKIPRKSNTVDTLELGAKILNNTGYGDTLKSTTALALNEANVVDERDLIGTV